MRTESISRCQTTNAPKKSKFAQTLRRPHPASVAMLDLTDLQSMLPGAGISRAGSWWASMSRQRLQNARSVNPGESSPLQQLLATWSAGNSAGWRPHSTLLYGCLAAFAAADHAVAAAAHGSRCIASSPPQLMGEAVVLVLGWCVVLAVVERSLRAAAFPAGYARKEGFGWMEGHMLAWRSASTPGTVHCPGVCACPAVLPGRLFFC